MISHSALSCLLGVLLLTSTTLAVRIPPSHAPTSANDINNVNTTATSTTTRRLRRLSPPVPKSPGDHLVTELPLLEESDFPTQHWAGHLPASSDGTKYFFYWLFAPDTGGDDSTLNNKTSTAPLIIWLNGGPGCSSMDGLFLENGPLRFVKDENGNFQLKPAPHSWHKAPAYTLYIDQPVGTGLSYTTSKYVKFCLMN